MDLDSPFDAVITRLESVGDQLRQFGEGVVTSPGVQRVMTNMNRAQMEGGIRADGTNISPEYTPYTKFLKAQKGQETEFVNLRDTGEFHADLRVEYDSDSATLTDDNEKTAKLKAKYGDEILGLTDENQGRIVAYLTPVFEGHIRQTVLPQLLER